MSSMPLLLGKDEDVPRSPNDEATKTPNAKPAEQKTDTPRVWHRVYDFLLLAGILVMLIWPWVFFGVVFASGGIQASNSFASKVSNYPNTVNFFSTLIATVITFIIDILFSFAIVRFAQEWVSSTDDKTTEFNITVMSSLRHHSWPWKFKDANDPAVRKGWLLVALVGAFIVCFTIVPSSITSLITPVIFNKAASLTGTELDFSSASPDCMNWLVANPIPDRCGWETYEGLRYTTCLGESQIVDVLEAGRGNILSLLSNNTQSNSFTQLSAGGLHFVGPIKGVLPIGPNGVPAFDTLDTSPLSIPSQMDGMISYNYTLEHQGLTSNISCMYDTSTPITTGNVTGSSEYLYQYSGTCDPNTMQNILAANQSFVQILSSNTLSFWACKSQPDAEGLVRYFIYLRGVGAYQQSVGDMTCTISPIQPAIFNVTYQSAPNTFGVSTTPMSTSPVSFSRFLDRAIETVGTIVREAQNWQTNLVSASVVTFGAKNFNLTNADRDNQYLRLYEAMIQGILEYEATYIRLLFSTRTDRPQSCTRAVTGTTSYQVVGWYVDVNHVGFLMPITLLNIAAMVILIVAILISKSNKRWLGYDPTGVRSLLLAYLPEEHKNDKSWGREVKYYRVAAEDSGERLQEVINDGICGCL